MTANNLIAVWFSCGVASACAAKITILKYGRKNVRVVYNPVIEEDSDNLRFLNDVETWIKHRIEIVKSKAYPSASARDVWADKKYMSGVSGAPYTTELKKKARQEWELEHNPKWHVLGFTYDELARHRKFVTRERSNVIPILIDRKLTKQDCFDMVVNAGIEPPRIYALGYPNANCIGCVKASSPTYWNLVREQHPEVFQDRLKQSREIGCKLVRVKGERVFLDQLKESDIGLPLKNYSIECNVFCEENELREPQE